jgi:hypothetical protein
MATQAEIDSFVLTGRNFMTALAGGGEQLAKWADTFEQRGGGAVYGEDATEIVYLSNDFEAWLTPERSATIARLRVDV